jgi:hypothetical protein
MNNLDPDLLFVLKTLAANGELERVAKVKAKHEKQLEERVYTQVELLADEVERVVPRDHPLFMPVLLGTALRKVLAAQQEPEFRSFLDEGFPQGW